MKTYELIKKLLIERPELRNSDKKLAWVVWDRQGLVRCGMLSKFDFMTVAEHFETIRRTRQMVQRDCPELKASEVIQNAKDEKRASKGTFVYRNEINSLPFGV